MKFAVLFSGQGSQKPGMGLDFLIDPLFNETIKEASKASKQDIEADFRSENDELKKTIHVQPALVAFEAGIYQMLKRDLRLDIAGMIGLSLGEYGAMQASGALNLPDTISLVSDRAKYMQEDADRAQSGMAALLKPDLKEVENLIDELQDDGQKVYLANYNSPKQVVIAGEKAAVKLAAKQISEQKLAKKVVLLRVNGAFHTPLFNEASKKMHQRLNQVTFQNNKIPVISNTTAEPFKENWASIMEKQLAVPTHFGECLNWLLEHEEVDATLEIGPGKTLTSFAHQIDRNLENYRIGSLSEYQKFIEEINGN